MTHDELSRQLEGLWHDSYKAPGYMALRAVVEFHKPICDDPNCCINQGGCECGEDFYPCLTVQVIEKELS